MYLFFPFVKSHHTFKVKVHYVPPQHAYCDCYTDFLCIFPSLSIFQEKKRMNKKQKNINTARTTPQLQRICQSAS